MNLALLGLAAAGAAGLFLLKKPKGFEAKHAGSSGNNWTVKLVKVFDEPAGKLTFWDVFEGSDRVLRYSQRGELKGSRVYITSPFDTSPSVTLAKQLRAAAADFGVVLPAPTAAKVQQLAPA